MKNLCKISIEQIVIKLFFSFKDLTQMVKKVLHKRITQKKITNEYGYKNK